MMGRTRLTETSLEAYEGLKPKLETRQKQVYDCLSLIEPSNNLMISKRTGLPINVVAGRMNELRNKLKIVGFVFKAICPITGKKTMFFRTVRTWEERYASRIRN